MPKDQITQLIARAADQEFITTTLRDALSITRTGGGTKAALIPDELNLHADSVANNHVESLLTAIFKLGDELDVSADDAKAFSIGDNRLRIHWLLRRLTLERFDLARRSAIFMAACNTAALARLVDFTMSAYEDHHPRAGRSPEPESNCLTTEAYATALHEKALSRIREAAVSGELGMHPELAYLLYRWSDLAKDSGAEAKQWTDAQLVRDEMVARFAKALTSHGWRQSGNNSVAERTTLANVDHLDGIIGKARLRARVEELAAKDGLPAEDATAIKELLDAWKQHELDPYG